MTDTSPLLAAADPAADEAIAVALAGLAAPGSFFTGAERVALAHQARFARGLIAEPAAVAPLVADTVARVAVEAMNSRAEHVAAWEADGQRLYRIVQRQPSG